jgi:YVTN family beta-propeller protein
MKHYTNKIIWKHILSAIVLIACIPIVSATPPTPESYWGYATLNGVPAPNGTSITVEVYSTSEVVGNTIVQYPNGGYSLDIIFNDTDTAEDEGADGEDALTWKINEINCSIPAPGTDTATSGGINGNFNLTATDTTAPVINSFTLDPTDPNTGDNIIVTVNATDNVGVTVVTADDVSLSNADGDDTWEGTITAINGTHTVNISASDAAGNTVYDETANYTARPPLVASAAPFAYITNYGSNNVSVIDTSSNTVTATVTVGTNPYGVAVNPAGTRVYVVNRDSNNVSVIDTSSNTVTATVTVGTNPSGVAVNPAGTRVYVSNLASNSVSVIDTSSNTVTATVTVGTNPYSVAVNPAGTRVYVSNRDSNNVSVIDTSSNTVTATVTVGTSPYGVAVNPAGTRVYVSNYASNNVSVIDTSSNTVTATVTVGTSPRGVAVNPAGTRVYVSNYGSNNVSVIDTSSNTVTATVTVGTNPFGVAVNPAGTHVYASNYASNNVSVIETSSNTVTATVTVGTKPIAFGIFISPGGASDTTAPGIKISTPQEGKSYNTSTIALNVTADESIDTWQYSINGTANVTFTSNTTLSSLPDGNHNVTVYANDSAGNMGSALVNFSIDTTVDMIAPVINSVTLAPTDPNTGDNITVTVNATDNVGVTTVTADGEPLSNADGDDTWEGTITAIEGTHTVNISASDAADNTVYDETANYTATPPPADNITPMINSVTLDPTDPNTGDNITVTVNATDNVGVTTVTADGEPLSNADGDDTWEGTITAIEGTHTVNISASDAAANTAYDETANYTATPPVPTLPVILVEDVTAAPNGYAFTSVMVKNVTGLGSGNVNVTFDPSIIQVIDVTSGDGNALTVQNWDIDNTAGLVQITAWDAQESHDGDVVFAHVTLHSVGDHLSSTPLSISSAELTNYDTYELITHTVATGTLDTIAPVVIIDNVEAASSEFTTALIMVNNASNLGSGNITVTYNTSVVHVTNVTSGDGNALAVQGWNVDNSAGLVQILAQDGNTSHNGDVVIAIVTFHAVGEYPDSTPLAISSSELIDYTSYGIIGHSVTNGTFSIIDNEPPVITDAIATSDVILNDNGRPRVPGTNVTVLNATVLDSESGVVNVTIDLSPIGGSDDQIMERIAGTDIWTVATTATDGINLSHELVVTATDGADNTNTSVIGLTVLLRGDIVRDGELNSADSLYIAKYLVGKESMPSLLVSDMSPAEGDGKITSADALYLAKYLVGNEAAP